MSPKNKGTHGKGAQPAHEPDEFVQRVNSFGDTIQPHIMKIVGVAVLGLVALSAWKVMDWRHSKQSKSATSAYFKAVNVAEAPVASGDEPVPAQAEAGTQTFATEEERAKASLDALAEVRDEHGGIALAKLADLRQAELHLKAKRYDDALALYKKFSARQAPEPLRLAALEGVGYSLEAKAMANEDPAARQSGLEEALRAFEQLAPGKDGAMRDYSLYHQGRLLVTLGKNDEGIAKFEELLKEVPDSALTVSVENRLATLGVGE